MKLNRRRCTECGTTMAYGYSYVCEDCDIFGERERRQERQALQLLAKEEGVDFPVMHF